MLVEKVYDFADLSDSHNFCLERIPAGSRVLEFGPATGYMTRALRDRNQCVVTGFEYSPEAAARAVQYCESIVVGDAEDFGRWDALKPPYDAIVFADVLEHLRRPRDVLARCRRLLSPRGQVFISIPNIAHWTVRFDLMRGRFDYTETGLLDDTHTRFFTRKTLYAMVRESGYEIEEVVDSHRMYPGDKTIGRFRPGRFRLPLLRLNSWIMGRLFPDAVTFQFFLSCRPADAPSAIPLPEDNPKVALTSLKTESNISP